MYNGGGEPEQRQGITGHTFVIYRDIFTNFKVTYLNIIRYKVAGLRKRIIQEK